MCWKVKFLYRYSPYREDDSKEIPLNQEYNEMLMNFLTKVKLSAKTYLWMNNYKLTLDYVYMQKNKLKEASSFADRELPSERYAIIQYSIGEGTTDNKSICFQGYNSLWILYCAYNKKKNICTRHSRQYSIR